MHSLKHSATEKEMEEIMRTTSDSILRRINAMPVSAMHQNNSETLPISIDKPHFFNSPSTRNNHIYSMTSTRLHYLTPKKESRIVEIPNSILRYTKSNMQHRELSEHQMEDYLRDIQKKIEQYKAESFNLYGKPCKLSPFDINQVSLLKRIKIDDLNTIKKSIAKYSKRISTTTHKDGDEYKRFISYRLGNGAPKKEEMLKAFSQNTNRTLSNCYKDILLKKNPEAQAKLQNLIISEMGTYVNIDTKKILSEVENTLSKQNKYARIRVIDTRIKRSTFHSRLTERKQLP